MEPKIDKNDLLTLWGNTMNHGMYDATHEPMQKRRFDYVSLLIGLGAVILMGRGIWSFIPERKPVKIISPVPEATPTPTFTPTSTPTPSPTPVKRPTSGKASYYSVAGCLGCRSDLKMANGEVFDDTKYTLAHNQIPLNTMVEVINKRNGKKAVAKVTDRGGFNKYNRIADLSLALAQAIDLKTDVDILTITPVK